MKNSLLGNLGILARAFAVSAAFVLAAGSAQAQLINIEFGSNYNYTEPYGPPYYGAQNGPGPFPAVASTQVTGAALVGTSTDTWNAYGYTDPDQEINGVETRTLTGLLSSTGTATGVSFIGSFYKQNFYGNKYGNTGYWGGSGGTGTAPSTTATELSYGYSYDNNYNSDNETLSGLTGSSYDLYLIWLPQSSSQSGQGSPSETDYTINGVTLTLQPGANYGTSWVAGQEYVEFANIAPIGGQITVELSTPNSSDGAIGLSGLQLQENVTEAVPEPSTYALMFGGLAFLVVWQRTRRSRAS